MGNAVVEATVPYKKRLGSGRRTPLAGEPQVNASQSDGDHYREIARQLRELARRFRFPGARQELLDLALRYERRANHLDARSSAEGSAQNPY